MLLSRNWRCYRFDTTSNLAAQKENVALLGEKLIIATLIKKKYFMKHVENIVNVIRTLQEMYSFFELL